MNIRKAGLITGLVMVLGIAAVPFVYGGPRGERHERHGPGLELFGHFGKLRHLRHELDLSDSQAWEIRRIALDVREENASLRAEFRTNVIGAAKVLLDDPNDLSGAESVLTRNAATEQALKRNILEGISKALGVLTPEQRVKLGTIVDRHHAGRG